MIFLSEGENWRTTLLEILLTFSVVFLDNNHSAVFFSASEGTLSFVSEYFSSNCCLKIKSG